MEGLGPTLTRIRWRFRGAWMWPAFVALTMVDIAIGHALPSSGESTSVGDAMVAALFLNLLAVALISRAGGVALRAVRPDLPAIVARDYAGTAVLLLVAAALLVTGLIHRGSIERDRQMLRDAIVRAQAYIGARAPAEFRENLAQVDTFTIEHGIYRTCVPGRVTARTYCVVVKSGLPLARSVAFAGYESNEVFAAGTR